VVIESTGPWSVAQRTGNVYDLAPDDQRFLVGMTPVAPEVGGAAAPSVVLVNNFFEELRARVPE
jgi:hypothetical protein